MRRIEPPSPLAVERMRARLRANARLRDATLVCLLAYAGLRPGEALALEWQHIGSRSLRVRKDARQRLLFGTRATSWCLNVSAS